MDRTAFISHASEDSGAAEKITAFLEKSGISCWIAPRDVRPGQEYAAEIVRGIAQSAVMVLVLSENANDSTFVKREVERAVSQGKPIFPIRVREVKPSQSLELFISSHHWIDAWKPPLEQYMDRLVEAINIVVSGDSTGGAGTAAAAPIQAPAPSGTAAPGKPLHRAAMTVAGLLILAGAALSVKYFLTDPSATEPGNPQQAGNREYTLPSNEQVEVRSSAIPDDPTPAVSRAPAGSNHTASLREEEAGNPGFVEEGQDDTVSISSLMKSLEGKSGAQRFQAIQMFENILPDKLSTDQALAIIDTSAYRLQALQFLQKRLPRTLSYEDFLKIVDPTRGADRFNTIREFANQAPDSLTTDQVLTLLESSAYRLQALQLLQKRLPRTLSYEDFLKIVDPTKGAERFSTIQEFANQAPDSLTTDQVLTLLESSAYRLQGLQLLQKRLPRTLSYEDFLKIVDPTKGAERFSTIQEFANQAPDSLTTDQVLTLLESSAYRLQGLQLLKKRLPRTLSYEDFLKIVDPTKGAERFSTIQEFANQAPDSLTTDQILRIVSSSAYRLEALELLKSRLPKSLSYDELVKIIDPVKAGERYKTINAFAEYAPDGLSDTQIDRLIESSSYPDQARKLFN